MKTLTTLFTLIIIFIGINITYGFEIDGLKDGMHKDVVMMILSRHSKVNNQQYVNIGKHIGEMFSFRDKFTNEPSYVTTFVNDKLVNAQKEYKPSVENYINLFRLLNEKYGTKLECISKSTMGKDGEEKSLNCIWTHGKELTTLNYHIFPLNHQLSVFYSRD